MSSIISANRPPAKPVYVCPRCGLHSTSPTHNCPAKADVRPLAYALARLTPGILDDPDPAAVDAARDILDDLLMEFADEFEAVAA